MNDILDLYARKYNPKEPVLGIDEKAIQILDHLHSPLKLKKEHGVRIDYQYNRKGIANIFLFVDSSYDEIDTRVSTTTPSFTVL